jgi:hypothetical protein
MRQRSVSTGSMSSGRGSYQALSESNHSIIAVMYTKTAWIIATLSAIVA